MSELLEWTQRGVQPFQPNTPLPESVLRAQLEQAEAVIRAAAPDDL
jgi:hypothetical protein